jgi:hypothetical protein
MLIGKRSLTSVLGVALSVGAVFAGSAASAASASPAGHAACTHALIAGESKCIARGEFCKHTAAAQKSYRRYGLSCSKLDANGRYHLR